MNLLSHLKVGEGDHQVDHLMLLMHYLLVG